MIYEIIYKMFDLINVSLAMLPSEFFPFFYWAIVTLFKVMSRNVSSCIIQTF